MKTVLIIEDNENNMELISFILEASSYKVIKADTGLLGQKLALELKPDLVVLDIQLPDIDGTKVLEGIRIFDAGHTIPVIAMTSFAMSGDRESLMAAGCDGYIEKPIDPDRVVSQIEAILGELSCES